MVYNVRENVGFTKEEIGALQCPNIKIPGIFVHLIVRMSKQKHIIDVKHT